MSQTLGIKFADYGQVYFFSSGPFVVCEGQDVLVKTEQGMGLGKVVTVQPSKESEDGESLDEHKPIYRLAGEKDLETQAENKKLSKEAFSYCRTCIRNHKLGMKLVDVEVFFDRSKMIFYFTAPGRIDFRELIKDLVREYRTRIELRQIGVRHETQMLGAIGNCGQLCCCRRFMRKFAPVTIKMAKEQNLFLNPTKISGICGRLLCCLAFEQEGYEEFNRMCPKIGKRYRTSMGMAKVLRSNFFNKSLFVLFEDGGEQEISIEEWTAIEGRAPQPREADKRSGKGEGRKAEPADQSGGERPKGGRRGERKPGARRGSRRRSVSSDKSKGGGAPKSRPRRRRKKSSSGGSGGGNSGKQSKQS